MGCSQIDLSVANNDSMVRFVARRCTPVCCGALAVPRAVYADNDDTSKQTAFNTTIAGLYCTFGLVESCVTLLLFGDNLVVQQILKGIQHIIYPHKRLRSFPFIMFQRGVGSPDAHQQRRGKDPDTPQYDSPIEELTGCLDRIEGLVAQIRDNWEEHGLATPNNPSPLARTRNLFRARRSVTDDSSKAETTKTEVTKEDDADSQSFKSAPMEISIAKEPEARYIPMLPAEEDEMVELLRRTAELVVMGEKAAAAVLVKEEKRAKKAETGDIDESEATDDDGGASIADLEPHIALFENFFERQALNLIVNIATGVAFSASAAELSMSEQEAEEANSETLTEDAKNDDTKSLGDSSIESGTVGSGKRPRSKSRMLPSVVVATQAVQSVSILIQNVSRATSLYFLLSNNHITDMINLPLEFYHIADRTKLGESEEGPVRRVTSPELAELTTHFITFLKSLALRMNVETLQFFLTYPNEQPDAIEAEHSPRPPSPSPPRASPTSFYPKTSPASPSSPSKPVAVHSITVEFPLFDRALDFCAAHHESFVRITAMNICLNTLKLVTVDGEASEPFQDGGMESSPDGTLSNAQALPLRERLAIAQHVCNPTRVENLVSPIFSNLAHLWGVLEEQIRDMDLLNEGKSADGDIGGPRVHSAKMEQAKNKARRKKATDALSSAVAALQDEFLLLEDVFQVGLTSINEQVIEMMLATFVYPLLMQPLLHYMQRSTLPSEGSKAQPADVYTVDVLAERSRNTTDTFDSGPSSERIQEVGPAKTALFALGGCFSFLRNPTLLRLLLTALFHPLAPDSSSETMIRAKPDVACVDLDGKMNVRTDVASGGSDNLVKMEESPYSFGNVTGEKKEKRSSMDTAASSDTACVFVLSPALTEVLEGQAGDVSLIAKTRPNPYRRAILQCLSCGPAMVHLRQLAVLMFDAMTSRFEPSFLSTMLLGVGMKTMGNATPLDEQHSDTDRAHVKNNRGMGSSMNSNSRYALDKRSSGASYMNEVVSALCLSIVNVSTSYKGTSVKPVSLTISLSTHPVYPSLTQVCGSSNLMG